MFVRTQTTGSRTYLLIVENQRVNGRIRQRVLHRLGRLDELVASEVVARADRVALLPPDLDFETAASLPLAYVIAEIALLSTYLVAVVVASRTSMGMFLRRMLRTGRVAVL